MPTFEEMRKTAFNLHAEERKLVDIEHELYQAKFNLINAKDGLEREISKASLSAYAEGKIDGKNEQQRKLQLDHELNTDVTIADMRQSIQRLESAIGDMERSQGYQKAQVRYCRNVFDAALATVQAAQHSTVNLQAA